MDQIDLIKKELKIFCMKYFYYIGASPYMQNDLFK